MRDLDSQIRTLVLAPLELRSVEYKGAMLWAERETKLKVAKAALGFSNLPDGGHLVFGVAERDGTLVPEGLTDDQWHSFSSDEVSAFVNEYADPPVALEVYGGEVDGLKFVVIRVLPFLEIPTICKKDADGNGNVKVLRRGAIYTRSLRMPETVEVPSQNEMREILERSVDIGVRRLRSRFPQLVDEPGQEWSQQLDAEIGAFA